MYKVFIVAAFLAIANAAPQATSYSSLNDNHNSFQHIDSTASVFASPAVAKVAFPTVQYSAPVAKVALPVAKYTPVAYSTPVAKYAVAAPHSAHEEQYPPEKYEFAYAIEDPHTGDNHSQQEQRDGDHVVGQYSLREADGTVRIVKYFDDGQGFNAVVEKQGHPTEAPAVYKKVVAVAAPEFHH